MDRKERGFPVRQYLRKPEIALHLDDLSKLAQLLATRIHIEGPSWPDRLVRYEWP